MARVVPSAALVSNLQIGARLPAHVTASGRMLLAHQDIDRLQQTYRLIRRDCRIVPPTSLEQFMQQVEQDRRRGYVHHRSILNPGTVSLACPVPGPSGAVAAAVTLIGPAQVFAAAGGEKVLRRRVADAATAIAQKLGYRTR
jgi:IclR family pca regulon transcriptional regulator